VGRTTTTLEMLNAMPEAKISSPALPGGPFKSHNLRGSPGAPNELNVQHVTEGRGPKRAAKMPGKGE